MAESKKDKSNQTGLAVPTNAPGAVPFSLAPRLPVAFDRRDGIANIKNYNELATQNLKMLVLTIPGERIMDPEFGVGLKTYIFQQNHPNTHAEISSKIYSQVARYLPFINIDDLIFGGDGPIDDPFDSNVLYLRIMFTIVPLQLSSTLELSVNSD